LTCSFLATTIISKYALRRYSDIALGVFTMTSGNRFRLRSRDIASEDFDGEYVVLDLASGKYFSLLGGSAIVWRGIMAGHSLDSLCAQMPADDAKRQAVGQLLEALVGHALIISDEQVGEAPAEISAELAASAGPFEVDVFDDLADLLVADPIHDVDPETGWPVMQRPER